MGSNTIVLLLAPLPLSVLLYWLLSDNGGNEDGRVFCVVVVVVVVVVWVEVLSFFVQQTGGGANWSLRIMSIVRAGDFGLLVGVVVCRNR